MARVPKFLRRWVENAFLPSSCEALRILQTDRIFVDRASDKRQDEVIGEFRNYIRNVVGKANPVLEIGPGYNPMLAKRDGYNVASLDHDDQEGLAKKFTALKVDISKLEPVDFVWREGKFADLLAGRKFEAVISSHVVEHAPDFVQFLKDSSLALNETGAIFLIVPDQRFCFDYFRGVSDPAKVLGDHLERRTRHSFASFYRRSMHATGNGGIVWGQHDLAEVKFTYGDPRENLEMAERKLASQDYVDAHENYFTPASFAMLIEELQYLGKIDVRLDLLTRPRGCEFLVALKKAPNNGTAPTESFLQRKKAWCAVRVMEDFERLLFANWAVST